MNSSFTAVRTNVTLTLGVHTVEQGPHFYGMTLTTAQLNAMEPRTEDFN